VIDLFISYSHEDEPLRKQLDVHLAMLKRSGLVSVWHDRRILAGAPIDNEICTYLEAADVILALLSPHFLASDYCYDIEAKRALHKHREGSAVVIPVILEPCDWLHSPFKALRATPRDGKPVVKYTNINEAFLEVAQDIRLAAEGLGKGAPATPKHTSQSSPTVSVRSDAPRSSNLRVKRSFTDHDRDAFVDECFRYLENFFENSLRELCERNAQFTHRFTKISHGNFTAGLYHNGDKKTACHIWLPGRRSFGGDIVFAANDSPATNSINDGLSVEDDGYQLALRPSGMSIRPRSDVPLTTQGAAEYLWASFISPVQ
jgi:hypothetical protein